MEKHLVVIGRKWHEPFIRMSVTDTDLKIVTSLEDFALAFAVETGVPQEKVLAGFAAVVKALKSETTQIV